MEVQAQFAEKSKALTPEMWTQFMAMQSPVLQGMMGEPRAIQKHVFANAGANAKANAKADWSDAWGLWNQALIKVNVGKIDT